MNTSATGQQAVRNEEGLRLQVYICAGGKATIGYGHKLKVGESFPNGITKTQAEQLFQRDISTAESVINKYVKVLLTQNQYDALVEFVFNIGSEYFRKSTILKRLNERKFDEAANEFGRWIYAGGKICEALISRRSRTRKRFSNQGVSVNV